LTDFVELVDTVYTITDITSNRRVYFSAVNQFGCESDITIANITISRLEKPTIHIDGEYLVSSNTGKNQWYFDGNIIEGDEGPQLKPTISGVYTAAVSDSLCIKYSDPKVFVVTSIKQSENSISIFPNPINKKILQISGDYSQFEHLQVVNLSGEIICSQALYHKNIGELKIHLPEEIKGGIYLVIMRGSSGTFTQKIMIK
jgi:hypothetical protein